MDEIIDIQEDGWRKAGRKVSVIGGIIFILASVWYIVVDRFEVIAQVKDNHEKIIMLDKRVMTLENDKKALDDIQYNLKRLIEKNGMKWEPFQ